MAVVLSNSFSKCFDQVQNACTAIEQGEAIKAIAILSSVKKDATLLHSKCKKLNQSLRRSRAQIQIEVEELTSKINDLYNHERNLEREKEALDAQATDLVKQRNRERESLREAQCGYYQAERDRGHAQDKYNTFLMFWWVPLVGQILLFREVINDYAGQARQAALRMTICKQRYQKTQRDINTLRNKIDQVESAIQLKNLSIRKLKSKRYDLHTKLGNTKEVRVFLLEATSFWGDIANMSENASDKTQRLERILNFAAKCNNIKILQSNGTRTLTGSFKECWMELENMMRNNDFFIFDEEDLYGELEWH